MWQIFLPIIAKHGVEFGYKLFELVQKNDTPTNDDWQALRLLARHHDDYIREAQQRLNPTPGTTNPIP